MALTYTECKNIALERNPKVNACFEYDNAYRFFEKSDIEITGDFEAVVLKETGKVMGWVSYLNEFHPAADLKEISF